MPENALKTVKPYFGAQKFSIAPSLNTDKAGCGHLFVRLGNM